MNKQLGLMVSGALLAMAAQSAIAAPKACGGTTYDAFVAAANAAATETDQFGFGLPMWATLVDTTGKVCFVYSTDSGVANAGSSAGNKAWLGSRVISAQKASTANAFSLNGLAISTGFIYAAVVPNGSLYGLQHSNPVDAARAYKNISNGQKLGAANDPMVGGHIGGVNVFGGGVALYSSGTKVGAIGASGDTSCRDHAFAYRMRIALNLDDQPGDDGLKLVAAPAALSEHPVCGVADPTAHPKDSGPADFGIR